MGYGSMPAKRTKPDALNDAEVRLAHEYARDLNGTKAYGRVHSKASLRTCQVEWCKTWKKPEFKAYVAQIEAERAERCNVSGDQVVDELLDIAFAPRAKPGVRLAALREIARMCGLDKLSGDPWSELLARVDARAGPTG